MKVLDKTLGFRQDVKASNKGKTKNDRAKTDYRQLENERPAG